jgi:hypothetical protein
MGTNGGVAFYQGHNANSYGFSPTEHTPMQGLGEVDASRMGYRLGLEYIKTNPSSIPKTILRGTVGLYSPSEGPVLWSIRLPRNEGDPWQTKLLRLASPAMTLTVAGSALLLSVAIVSLVALWSWPGRAIFVVTSFIFMNWLLYAVVFWGAPRYRYFAEVLFCVCTGVVIAKLLNGKPIPGKASLPPSQSET